MNIDGHFHHVVTITHNCSVGAATASVRASHSPPWCGCWDDLSGVCILLPGCLFVCAFACVFGMNSA